MSRMQEESTSSLYDLWSLFYDYTFGALVRHRQFRAIEQFNFQEGDRVLDIGVGTGMCLPHYPGHVKVIGMDLSEGMLRKAKDKCDEKGLKQCRLVRADAMFPPFAEQSFDHILISHTVSVVSDPSKLMSWAARLIKPGGRIVVLNHFQSTNKLIGKIESVVNPVMVKIGWRSDLSLEDTLAGVPLYVDYAFQLRAVDVWKIVVLSTERPSTSGGAEAVAEQLPTNTKPAAGMG